MLFCQSCSTFLPMVLLGISFGKGLVAAFSACVYPLIPITTALFSIGETRKWYHGFILSFIYVAGMSLTYVCLGLMGVYFGGVFGTWLGKKEVIAGFMLIFFYLGFAFAGLLPLPLPNFADKIRITHRAGIVYPFTLGIFSGFIAAPCTAPWFVNILAQIAESRAAGESPMFGILQSVSFALGIGFPFLLIGGFALKLPKPGQWLGAVKVAGGIFLLTAGVHYMEKLYGPYPPERMRIPLALTGALVSISFFLISEPFKDKMGMPKMLKAQTAMILFISAVGLFFTTSYVSTVLASSPSRKDDVTILSKSNLTWLTDIQTAQKTALAKNQFMFIDFWAEWCTACHEMDAKLFKTKQFEDLVQEHKLLLVRLDFTDPDDSLLKLAEKYKIFGLPTVVLADSNGKFIHSSVGFTNPKRTLIELKKGLHTPVKKL